MTDLRIVPSKRTPIVIETGPGWELTADIEDEPPQHNHRDIWDAPDTEGECPRCDWDIRRAGG